MLAKIKRMRFRLRLRHLYPVSLIAIILFSYGPDLFKSLQTKFERPSIAKLVVAKRDQFQVVDNTTTVVYSAYYDDRVPEIGPVVRILGFIHRSETYPLFCRFYYRNGQSVCSQQAVMENLDPMNNVHTDLDFFFVCKLPSNEPPIAVTLTLSPECNSQSNLVRVISARPTVMRDFGVCLSSPVYQKTSDNAHEMIEIIEMNRLLGANAIHMANFSMTPGLDEALQYYTQRGIVETKQWNPVDKNLNVYGQTLALNDCLYRNMYKFKYLVFTDLDELIVPHKHQNWKEMMMYLERKNIGAYIFQNVYFFAATTNKTSRFMGKEGMFDASGKYPIPNVITHRLRSKEALPPPMYTKYILDPTKVLSVVNHQAYNLVPGYVNFTVPLPCSFLHHLKGKVTGQSDEDLILDTAIDPFVPRLMIRMHERFYKTQL